MTVWLRRLGMVLVGIVLLVVVAIAAAYALSAARIGEEHALRAHPFDSARGDYVHGQHLVATYGCTECHGEHLEGRLLIDGMPFARIPAPNLTSGRDAGPLTDDDWELAVRHGIGANGRALAIMPSPDYVYMSDADLADIVAYVRTLPATTDDLPPREFGPVGRALIAFGQLEFAPDLMREDAKHLTAPVHRPDRDFGFYLTRFCTGCHGPDLAGAPPSQPDAPAGPNLTPAGHLGQWSYAQFEQTIRTGRTPEGRSLNPQFMPWTAIRNADDTELHAIWAYLSSLGALPDETGA